MTTLHDVITEHPAWIGLACVSWIAIGVWIMSLLGWMIQGEVDVLFGVGGIAVALALGYFSFNPPAEALRPFVAVALIGTIVVFPFLRHALSQRALLAIDVEAMENAYEMLRMKPDNHLMRFKLGKLLYERGHVAPGIAVADEALKHMPENLFTDEHRMASRWHRLSRNVPANATVTCMDCGHPNPPANLTCEECGQPHLLNVARGRWIGRQFARRLLAGWAAGIFALIGIGFATLLPPGPSIIVILGVMALALGVIWLGFRQTGGLAHS